MVWVESNKLWRIAGPAILSLVAAYSTNIAIQAFGGRLGDVQLAAISVANNVIFGFSFGLLPEDVAKLSGFVALWMLPVHFSYAFLFPLQTILQSRIKNKVISCTYAVGLVLNIFTRYVKNATSDVDASAVWYFDYPSDSFA
ncbi:hypothetical protein WN943_008649 [Citrus x changshan-huyou]